MKLKGRIPKFLLGVALQGSRRVRIFDLVLVIISEYSWKDLRSDFLDTIKNYFEKFGELEECRMMRDKITSKT